MTKTILILGASLGGLGVAHTYVKSQDISLAIPVPVPD